ncbi:MAG: hypothetical protein ABEH64_00910 [Salinirussus sp.]
MVAVRYRCPRCGTVVSLDREARLADKSVTPYPLEGWNYTGIDGDYADADGVRIVCGDRTDDGCGEPYYLNFVRYQSGRAVDPPPESEYVTLASDSPWPTGP